MKMEYLNLQAGNLVMTFERKSSLFGAAGQIQEEACNKSVSQLPAMANGVWPTSVCDGGESLPVPTECEGVFLWRNPP
ncbi:hypothetical protein KOE80_00760 [Alcaligenes sp. 13f]|uniref:hypothetical protein n=1 Tax=Alcaligenes sp. 13f TaxID=2841924 RepID=UPI001CF6835B|nr:hypothetical protein [Alcaligenes sp. 13f]MCB4320729.1 hypothetical protein [Alcaligenes sp. 13f]